MKIVNTFLLKLFFLISFYLIFDNLIVENFYFFKSLWLKVFGWGRLFVLQVSTFLLETFYNANVIKSRTHIMIEGSAGVFLGNPCVGIGLIYSAIALIIAYPGRLFNKVLFSILGTFGILFLNAIRVVYLVITVHNNQNTDVQNQHDFFNFIIYTFIFVLWVVWVSVEQRMNKNNKDSSPQLSAS